ncbi:MAG: tRNA epoxyqueuosine(34) reductase QueG [Bacteroides sp.]|nr:tRNA epoxyqueuosine(34) reductase QueG [Bacteroides sp.]
MSSCRCPWNKAEDESASSGISQANNAVGEKCSSCSSTIDCLDGAIRRAGGVAWGIARLEPVEERHFSNFESWLKAGNHGEMRYMEHYSDIRRDPRLLLDGAKSIIVVAFPYYHHDQFEGNLSRIAAYAHGDDYHEVLRERLATVVEEIKANSYSVSEKDFRICVDTAPLFERYWAVKAGVGFIGRNRMLIVPGYGSYVFLGSIITKLELPESEPCRESCMDCGRCVEACPTGALDGASCRCLSYLTIEYRGQFDEDVDLHGRLYGCDICQRVCPLNAAAAETSIAEFHPREALRTLLPEKAIAMTQSEFSTIMRHSAIKRTKLAGLQRNALRLLRK